MGQDSHVLRTLDAKFNTVAGETEVAIKGWEQTSKFNFIDGPKQTHEAAKRA